MAEQKFDILSISERAKNDLRPNVIDGTVGMLFDEDHKLLTFKSICSVLQSIDPNDYLAYGPSTGSKELKAAMLSFILAGLNYQVKKSYTTYLTVGGTGALSMCSYCLKETIYLVPDLFWPNYKNIFELEESNTVFYRYNNVGDLIAKIKSIDANKDIALLINDPAQNPTGYSYSEGDYLVLKDFLNSHIHVRNSINLIMDIAYNDYSQDPTKVYRFLDNLDPSLSIFITFSASKPLSLYGLRTGALLVNSKDLDAYDTKINLYARKTYSCPPNIGFVAISKLSEDYKQLQLYYYELSKARELLSKRGQALSNELNSAGIKHEIYRDGFYLTLVGMKDSISLCKKLEKKGTYLVPLDNDRIRIALCSLNLAKIKILPTRIIEVMNEN